jgi:serine/threonine protein kinase
VRVVAGRYAIREELGRGGMGVVWRADDQVIGRQVALKELPAPHGLTGDERAVYLERILREARTAGRLNDPAVVTVFDVVSENGVTYIVMELVEAPTLADVIAEGGALPAERVAAVGAQVLGALQSAHAAGIVHRDVKPSNIMVLPGDRVKLADFGIARAMDDPSLTMTGGIMGSPGYMAPELFSGSSPAPASDLWALGATLFHAVEGRAPFHRETTAATMHAIMYDDPSLTRCQGPLAQVIMGLLAQSAETRLTAARARELLTSATKVIADPTQVVDAPTVQVEAVSRDTLPREPWQESYPPELPLAAPSWGAEEEWTPRKKPRGRRIALLAGAAGLVVAALVAVFLISPSAQQGEASGEPGTSAVAVAEVAGRQTPSGLPSLSLSAAPASGPSAAATVTVTKPAGSSASQKPPPSGQQPPAQQPQRALVVLTRYNHPTGWHVSATSGVPAPSGFVKEYPLGSLVAAAEPNAQKIFACKQNTSDDRFTSLNPTCEGHKVVATLGYIFSSAPAGAKANALYRCTYSGGHFDSIHADCEGYKMESRLGYLLG